MINDRVFHISEEGNINIFYPRPSPSYYKEISEDCVFAVSEQLLHNYLLPRDCPRVTYYAAKSSTEADVRKFFANSSTKYVVPLKPVGIRKLKIPTYFAMNFQTISLHYLIK